MRFALALFAVALAFSGALAARAHTGTLMIQHRDPGCHLFYHDGKLSKRVVVRGKVKVRNLDVLTQVVRRNGKVVTRIPVGGSRTLGLGTYKIRMVVQMPDDNVLTLVVRKNVAI